jgi:hypothetical protein
MCGVGVTSAAEPESTGATTSGATEWPTFALRYGSHQAQAGQCQSASRQTSDSDAQCRPLGSTGGVALMRSAERGRARLRRVGATCAGATTVKGPPWTIPSRGYATISLRGTVQSRRLCLAFHSWFASTRVSRRRSVIGMIGCSGADRGLCALKGGVCTVLLELQAKLVTPFARDDAATL